MVFTDLRLCLSSFSVRVQRTPPPHFPLRDEDGMHAQVFVPYEPDLRSSCVVFDVNLLRL